MFSYVISLKRGICLNLSQFKELIWIEIIKYKCTGHIIWFTLYSLIDLLIPKNAMSVYPEIILRFWSHWLLKFLCNFIFLPDNCHEHQSYLIVIASSSCEARAVVNYKLFSCICVYVNTHGFTIMGICPFDIECATTAIGICNNGLNYICVAPHIYLFK